MPQKLTTTTCFMQGEDSRPWAWMKQALVVSFIFIVVNLMFLEKNLSRIHAELDIKLMFKLYVYKEKCSCYTVILL